MTIDKLLPLTSSHCNSEGGDWVETKPGLFTKTLFENTETGDRVVLSRSRPGHRSAPHAHEELEHVYVLSGSFFDDQHLMRAGDYCVRAPGAIHAGGTDEGAVILSVYSAR
jgi:quercetin dioxygenase-like cupin family protein